MQTALKTDVLIVGAGPTGLSLACQCIRYGIAFVLIEKNETVTPYSKAIAVQARTLEIYDQLGLAQQAVEQGQIARRTRFIVGGKVRGEMEFSRAGEGLSPFPFALLLEQSKNEELLYEYLKNHGEEVMWQTSLERFSQNDEGVTAQIKTADGQSQVIEAKYLVGCDGAKSPVRHALGLSFEGSTFERLFFVTDVQLDWAFPHDAIQVCLAQTSTVLFFPMQGEGRYRIVGYFPEELNKEAGEILYQEIERHIEKQTKLKLDIKSVNWFRVYKVHTRRANKFSEGRCFVAGDAAHIHSPVGGQGMNTGIQDVYNLAWKLAFVLKGHADESLLETYSEERVANAQKLLASTDRAFAMQAGHNWIVNFVRTVVFPPLAQPIARVVGTRFFMFISQIRINYRKASLSRHGSDDGFAVNAGDRMPYFLVNGESVYERLHHPKFHLLVFSDVPQEIEAIQGKIESQYGEIVDFNFFPFSPEVGHVFHSNKPFLVLLRPDNHIGVISHECSASRVGLWIENALNSR